MLKSPINGRFVKGQSGNPGGRPSLPLEIKKLRTENMSSVIRILSIYANLTYEQALKRAAHPDALFIEEMVIGLMKRACEGDVHCFKFVVETISGKIPEHNDDDVFSDEDLRILRRVKEIREEEKK